MSSGNPASRLLEIAEQAKGLREGLRVRDGWSRIFGTGDDGAKLMEAMGQAMRLPYQVLAELSERYPGQEAIHQHWVSRVTQAFLVDGINGQWKSVQQSFDAITISQLTMASNLMDQPRAGETMRPEEVAHMKEQLEVFLKEVSDSAMSEASKEVIHHHVSQILEALDERGINSREAVEDAVHMTMGKAAMDQEVRQDLATSGMGERLQSTMAFVYQTVSAAKDAGQLWETMRRLLGDGG